MKIVVMGDGQSGFENTIPKDLGGRFTNFEDFMFEYRFEIEVTPDQMLGYLDWEHEMCFKGGKYKQIRRKYYSVDRFEYYLDGVSRPFSYDYENDNGWVLRDLLTLMKKERAWKNQRGLSRTQVSSVLSTTIRWMPTN